MDDDYDRCDGFPESHGSLLDLAFKDRLDIWEELAQELDRAWEKFGDKWTMRVFEPDIGKLLVAPGRCFPIPEDDEGWGEPSYSYDASNYEGAGPDGKVEKLLIETPQQFTECIDELMAQLKMLKTFAWSSPVTPVPLTALQSLARSVGFTSLHVNMSTYRTNLFFCEYSQCAPALVAHRHADK